MRRVSSGQSGFTLIEVLVASAIAIASMGLLMSLFAASLDRMSRIETQSQRLIVEKEIVSRLSLVNPAFLPSGQGRMGAWSYRWESEPITEFHQVTGYFSGEAPQRFIALYLMKFEIADPDNKKTTMEVKRLGWRSG